MAKGSQLSEALKEEVTRKANELIENVLKPKYLEPPPENPQFNYIIDIYGKWYHSTFYFCATYTDPGPTATVPSFESRFARMEYASSNRFHLSFMRHTEQWERLYTNLTVNECLADIKDDPFFSPG